MARSHRRVPLLWYKLFTNMEGESIVATKSHLHLCCWRWIGAIVCKYTDESKRKGTQERGCNLCTSNPKVSPWSATHLINTRNGDIAETIVTGAITDWFYEDQDILLVHERRLGKTPLRRRTPARVGLRRDICRASVLIRAAATEPAEILRTLQPWS